MCRDHDDVQIDGTETVNTRRFSEVIQGTYKLKNLVSLLGLLHEDLLHKIEANVHRAGHGIGRLLENIPDELLMKTMRFACQTRPLDERKIFTLNMLSPISHQQALSEPRDRNNGLVVDDRFNICTS